jgi:Ca-activated chloride channel family protein
MLSFLLLIPLSVGFYISLQRRRQRIAASHTGFTGGGFQNRYLGQLRHLPPIFFLVSLIFLTLALARPEMTISLPRLEGTVILAFDVSGSMAAEDLQPSRMAAAKVTASEFVKRQPSSVQIGVVAFSEGGLSVQAPTNDQTAILASIDRLEPQRGTSLGYGILTALDTIVADNDDTSTGEAESRPTQTPVPQGKSGPALIVLFTDGENNAPPDPFEAAYTASTNGVKIFAVGIGSPAGTTLKIDGFTVHTQLNETALEQISGLTGGEYYNAQSEDDLRQIYDNLSPELVIRSEKFEVTALFAGISILTLLIGGGLMLFWFGRLP